MFKPNSIQMGADDAAHYYTKNFGKEDYYLKDSEPPGKWNDGAASLGLIGSVKEGDFKKILEGDSPLNDKSLMQKGGVKKIHAPGWDLTFSAPKSVSILYARLEGKEREIVRKCHEESVSRAMDFTQKNFMNGAVKRVRKDKETMERKVIRESPKNIIYSSFEHRTSRLLDPQLHSHVVTANLAQRNDDTWGGIDLKEVYINQRTIGAAYRSHLAHLIHERLGVLFVRDNDAYGVDGISKKFENKFSKRREQILTEIERIGLSKESVSDHRKIQKVAVSTRAKKENISNDELFSLWKTEMDSDGFTVSRARKLLFKRGDCLQSKDEICQEMLDKTFKDITFTDSVFDVRKLNQKLAENSQTLLGIDDIERVMSLALKSDEIVPVGVDLRGLQYYTTKSFKAVEEKMMETAFRISQGRNFVFTKDKIIRAITTFEKIKTKENKAKNIDVEFKLSKDQILAIYHTLEGGDLSVIQGLAGTGKTTVMEVLRLASDRSKHRIFGLAPTHKAANELQGANISSQVIDKALFLYNSGKSFYKKGDTLILDEAGMVSTKNMQKLLDMVEERGLKLVLVGDSKQLNPIQAGSPFRSIKEKLGFAELSDVRRQKGPKSELHKNAALLLRNGKAEQSLALLQKEGLVEIFESLEETKKDLVENYMSDRIKSPEKVIKIIASLNQDVFDLNDLARKKLVENGSISKKGHKFLIIDAKGNKVMRTFAVGDELVIRGNDKKLGLFNGALGKVKKIRGNEVVLDFPNNADMGQIAVPMAKFNKIDYAYAGTVHLNQGGTNHITHALASSTQTLNESYVLATRHKESIKIYLSKNSLNNIDWSTYERSLSFEERRDIQKLNALKEIAKSWSKEQKKLNISDFDMKDLAGKPLQKESFLISQKVKDLIESLPDREINPKFVKDLRVVYLSSPAVTKRLNTPNDLKAPWQREVFNMIRYCDFSQERRQKLLSLVKDAEVGITPTHTEVVENQMNKRRKSLEPYFKESLAVSDDFKNNYVTERILSLGSRLSALDPSNDLKEVKNILQEILEAPRGVGGRSKGIQNPELAAYQKKALYFLKTERFDSSDIRGLASELRCLKLGEVAKKPHSHNLNDYFFLNEKQQGIGPSQSIEQGRSGRER